MRLSTKPALLAVLALALVFGAPACKKEASRRGQEP